MAKRKKAFGKTFVIQDRRLRGEGEKKEKKMTMVIRKKKEVI